MIRLALLFVRLLNWRERLGKPKSDAAYWNPWVLRRKVEP